MTNENEKNEKILKEHFGREIHDVHIQMTWMMKYVLHKHKNEQYDETKEFENDIKDQKRHYG
eukprot:5150133-Amphidinium_carterae.1